MSGNNKPALHSISDDLRNDIDNELQQHNNWVAFNASTYHLEKVDVYYFKDKVDAIGFASDNHSDQDFYKVISGNSLREIVDGITFGRTYAVGENLNELNRWSRQPEESTSHSSKINYDKQHTFLNIKNNTTMNEKNFDYLKDQIKFSGFGEGLENELKEKMQKQSPNFMLLHQGSFGKDETITTLHFKKSDQSDMYFFNRYDMTLKQDNKPEGITQSIYLNKGNNITLKEAYNLMQGRAVNKDLTNKEGQVYNAWVQMDFKQADKNGNYKLKQFHQNYGFDLEKALSKLPIKELSTEQDKAGLLYSLQKGNRQAVTFSTNGVEQRQYIEANPQFKSINIYDQNMNRLAISVKKSEKQTQGESQSTKKEAQKVNKADPDISQTKKQGKRKSQSIA